MEPEIVEKPQMTLVGLVGCGADVSTLDIGGLWSRFERHVERIEHRIEGTGYEVHIEEETSPPMHFALVGVEVERIGDIPLELFVKVIPAWTYAVFTHRLGDGSFGSAFEAAYDWIRTSDYRPARPFDIQVYDQRFRCPDDPESVLEIMVPLERGPGR